MRVPEITQRRAGLGFLTVSATGALISIIVGIVTHDPGLLTFVVFGVVIGGLLVFYWRTDWHYMPHIVVTLYTLLFIVGNPEPYVSTKLTIAILTPPLLALVLLDSWWILGSGMAVLVGMLVRSGGHGPLGDDPVMIVIAVTAIILMILGREVISTAQRRAERHRARAEAALVEAQQARDHLELSNQELQTTNADQLQLLQLISTLETPAVAIADGTVLVPIVGHLDTRRAADLNTRILQLVYQQGIRTVLLDLAGIAVADTHVARALNAMIQAVGLLGAQVVVTGITAETAMIFSDLGIHFARTARSPQDALVRYGDHAPTVLHA